MKVFKIWPDEGCNPYIEKDLKTAIDWLGDESYLEIDTVVKIEVLEMTEAEYDALPEYMGP